VGGGVDSDVGANTLTLLVSGVANITGVTNSSPADGGADAESLNDIRQNAPRSLTTLDRAVTLNDYANLALKVAGVSKAAATALIYTNISLYIAPFNGAPTNLASAALRAAVTSYLNVRKMVNATVTLFDPTYVPITVTASVNVLPQFQQEATRLEVVKAVNGVLAFANVDFGVRITISQVYKAIMAVPGVDYATVSVLSRTGTGLADVQMAVNEIPNQGTITVTATGGIIAG
jgi:predicted phage baseplate assembly protein